MRLSHACVPAPDSRRAGLSGHVPGQRHRQSVLRPIRTGLRTLSADSPDNCPSTSGQTLRPFRAGVRCPPERERFACPSWPIERWAHVGLILILHCSRRAQIRQNSGDFVSPGSLTRRPSLLPRLVHRAELRVGGKSNPQGSPDLRAISCTHRVGDRHGQGVGHLARVGRDERHDQGALSDQLSRAFSSPSGAWRASARMGTPYFGEKVVAPCVTPRDRAEVHVGKLPPSFSGLEVLPL